MCQLVPFLFIHTNQQRHAYGTGTATIQPKEDTIMVAQITTVIVLWHIYNQVNVGDTSSECG